jgi:hypothetical protein
VAGVVPGHSTRAPLLELDWPLIDAVDEALGLLERDTRAGYLPGGRLRGLRSLHVGAHGVIYQLVGRGRTVRVVAIRYRPIADRVDPRCATGEAGARGARLNVVSVSAGAREHVLRRSARRSEVEDLAVGRQRGAGLGRLRVDGLAEVHRL